MGKHRLKFVRRGVEFLYIESWPYRFTWDFECFDCGYIVIVDRDSWIRRLKGSW